MKLHAVLNRSGGTLKTTDLDILSELIRDEFRLNGHEIEVEICDGAGIRDAIGRAAGRRDIDALLVGGGDGTVAAAAAALMKGPLALAILPAGTMNLFARSLQIPLTLAQAVTALASGRIVAVDIATVNGRPFIHQFAVGLHARMVRARESFSYSSRVGKMWATTRAIAASVRKLPNIRLKIGIDGEMRTIHSPAVAISNNVYGEGHLPYADNPQGGKLGLYICRTDSPIAVSRLALDMLRGAWNGNKALTILDAKSVRIEHGGGKKEERAVSDGELVDLDDVSEIEIHESALKVVVTADSTLR